MPLGTEVGLGPGDIVAQTSCGAAYYYFAHMPLGGDRSIVISVSVCLSVGRSVYPLA